MFIRRHNYRSTTNKIKNLCACPRFSSPLFSVIQPYISQLSFHTALLVQRGGRLRHSVLYLSKPHLDYFSTFFHTQYMIILIYYSVAAVQPIVRYALLLEICFSPRPSIQGPRICRPSKILFHKFNYRSNGPNLRSELNNLGNLNTTMFGHPIPPYQCFRYYFSFFHLKKNKKTCILNILPSGRFYIFK